jgi:hypothetical protein
MVVRRASMLFALALAVAVTGASQASGASRRCHAAHCARSFSYVEHVVLRRAAGARVANRTLLWGAQIGSQFTGLAAPWDMSAVSDFQQVVGKAPSIVPMNLPFEGCSSACSYYSFPATQLSAIRGYGAIPMLNWASMSSPLNTEEPGFRLADVADGAFDAYIRSFAVAAKAWGHPFFLRFDWEMNGDWFPWAQSANGNHPGDFVAAWRHVHEIFTSVGATNVTWVWCPNVDPYGQFTPLQELYPGNGYVDWTCLDGYNFGSSNGAHEGGWSTFNQIYSKTYNQIVKQIAPSKPMIIGEVASSEHGGSKAAWITNMLGELPTHYPRIRAFVWFDTVRSSGDWPLEDQATSVEAFSRGVRSGPYASNSYGHLSAGAIVPPA